MAEGIGRSVTAVARMGTVAMERGGVYAEEEVEVRKSGRRPIGEGEGKDEGGEQEGVQGRGISASLRTTEVLL